MTAHRYYSLHPRAEQEIGHSQGLGKAALPHATQSKEKKNERSWAEKIHILRKNSEEKVQKIKRASNHSIHNNNNTG